MRRTLTILASVAALALVAYVGYGIYAAGLSERPPPPPFANITFARGKVTGHRITSRSWSADFDRIVSNSDQSLLELENVHHGVIFKNGKPYLHVRTAHLSVNTISRDFSASGPIHVETVGTRPMRSFDTNSAAWNDTIQRLTLSRPIVIHNGSSAPLTVGSLTFDVKTGQIEIRSIDGPVEFK
ncbi:MAG: hypothetical protein IAI49_11280 [Candidatus Eremiobacteraeota bacterium]|nr:hypothetical protein [Candidatus Eremiobacteraeota bacterium]